MANISFITIGTELLKGRIVNTNAAEAGLLLRKHGFDLNRVVSIPDTEEAILETLNIESELNDVILISGGLGPTKDDITKHTLAKWANTELIWHEETLHYLEQRYAARGRQMNRLTKAQALVPAICQVVKNHHGTAPGMCFLQNGKMVVSMPGVPFEMLYMLEHEVIPLMQIHYEMGTFRHTVLRLADIPESGAAERMETLEDSLARELDIAYLPRADGLWLELSVRLEEQDPDKADGLLQNASQQISHLFRDKLYAIGETALSQLLIDFLSAKHLTLGIIEMTSGGLIASKLYECEGVSDTIVGTLHVANRSRLDHLEWLESNGVQESSGEILAKQLAEKAREIFHGDMGLATVGQPSVIDGKAAEVWIAIADGRDQQVRHATFLYQRKVNIDRTTHYAMQFCLKIAHERFA